METEIYRNDVVLDVPKFDMEVQTRTDNIRLKAMTLESLFRKAFNERLSYVSPPVQSMTLRAFAGFCHDKGVKDIPFPPFTNAKGQTSRIQEIVPVAKRRPRSSLSMASDQVANTSNANRRATRQLTRYRGSGIGPAISSTQQTTTSRKLRQRANRGRPSIAVYLPEKDANAKGSKKKTTRNKKRETFHVSMELKDGNELILPAVANELNDVKSQMNKDQINETVERMKEMQDYFAVMLAQLQDTDL
eukprot:CFRG5458T1